MIYFFAVFVWLVCGFVASGLFFAFFQRKFPALRADQFELDKRESVIVILFGISSLIYYIPKSNRKHGWLNPFGKKAKIEAGLIDG